MKNLILCFVLPIVFCFEVKAQTMVRQTAGRYASEIGVSSLSSTTPSLNFTVPAGQICKMTFSISGFASSATNAPVARVVIGGTAILHVGGGFTGVTPFPMYGNANAELYSGSYTYDMYTGTWAVGSGNLTAVGVCYYK